MAARFESGALESYGAVESAGAGVTVPEATLLFTGDFSRAGSDLMLTGPDGAKFVVAGYFNTDNPPALLSPEGAMLTGGVVTALAGPQFPGQYAQAGGAQSDAQGAEAIGKVTTVAGGATVVRADGTTETLEVGDPVFQGDVVQTGAGAKLGIGFIDGTVFSLSANARMVLNSLVYNPDGTGNSMLFSLVEGTFVFAAGKIAPTGDMKINTPVATMGIRGTTPTVTIDSQTGVVNFSIVPDPGTDRVGNYTLYSLTTGDPIGTITDAGSTWQLTSADGTVTEIPKTEDDLLNDQNAINDINNVFNQFNDITRSTEPPDSSGFQSNPQNDNTNNDPPQGNDPPPNNTPGGDGPPGDTPPPGNDQSNNDPPPDPTGGAGVNVINGAGKIDGTDGDDVIFGSEGSDTITAFAGDDTVFARGGGDTIIAGSGQGDDDYDGGDGTDEIRYTSTENGVTINLVDGTVVGPEIDSDTIANIERFIGGSGDDTIIVDEDSGWFFDGGAGIDTVRIEGDLDIDTATVQSDAINVEVVDLNNDAANTFTISVDDFIDPENDTDTLQIRGDGNDKVVLTNLKPADPEFDYPGGSYNGSWQFAGTTELDEVDYNIYLFLEDGVPVPLGVAQIEVGVDVVTQSIETVQDIFQTSVEPRFDQGLDGVQFAAFSQFNESGPEAGYGLNSGSIDWTSNWTEINDDFGLAQNGDPDDGEIFISHDQVTNEGNLQLTLTDNDNEVDSGGDFIQRSADLSGAATAILTFDFRRVDMEMNDHIQVYASKDGQPFQQIGTITGTGTDDAVYQTISFDITDFISDNTTIRFGVSDAIDNGDTLYIDNVSIFQYGPEQAPEDLTQAPEAPDIVFGTNQDDVQTEEDGGDLYLGFNGNDNISTEGNDGVLLGGGGDDELEALSGDNILIGGPGNDLLTSGSGSDYLDGGSGDDTLTLAGESDYAMGGDGADVFRILSDGGEVPHDILDFDVNQDTLDITQLLTVVFDPGDADNPGHDIDDFVRVREDGQGNTIVSVDDDGQDTGVNFTDIAVLQGVGGGSDITVTIGDHEDTVTPPIVA